MLSQQTIDAVNDLDIVQVIQKFVPDLKKSGASWKAKSPFTEEKSASFVVSPSKSVWKCFSTGKGGRSPISFVMEKCSMTYPEAIKELANQFAIPIEFNDSERSKKYQEQQERIKTITEINSLALEFFTKEENLKMIPLEKRRAIPEMYERFQLGYAPDSWDSLLKFMQSNGISNEMTHRAGLAGKNDKGKFFDFFRGRIMFPIFTASGKIIGFSGRNILDEKDGKSIPKILNTPETEAYSKSRSLLGISIAKESIQKNNYVLKVEGNFDVTSMHAIGFENTIAPLGTAFTAEQIEILRKYTDTIWFIVDNDKAGKSKLHKDTLACLEQGMKPYIYIPAIEGADPDDMVQQTQPTEWTALKNEISENVHDAVEYLVESFFENATKTVEKTNAEAKTAELLATITDAHLRNSYVKKFAKEYGIERKIVEEKIKVNIATKAVSNNEEVDGFILPRHLSKDEIQDFSEYGFYSEIEKNKIGYYFPKGNSFKDFERVSNFIIKPIFQVENKDDSKRIVEIQNPHKKVIMEISNKAFLSLQAFREAVGNHGNFYFRGNANQHQNLIIKLMAQFPFCSEIRTLGWNKTGNFYAFADGIIRENSFKKIDPFGIVEHNDKKYFLPAFSEINKSIDEDDDYFEADRFMKFRQNNNVNIRNWSTKMERVYGSNGIWAALYFVSCCFRDVIFFNQQIFPIMFMVGQPQTGKSTCARSLATIFTYDQPAFNLSTGTAVGFQRRLARIRNGIIWLDEYRNDLETKRFQALKGGFDGTGAEKGVMSQDNRTKATKINSGYIISGQHFPTIDENALLVRSILLEFTRKQEDLTPEDVAEYDELNKWQMEGLSNLIIEIVAFRDYFAEEWRDAYNMIYKKCSLALMNHHSEGRIMQCYSVALTTLHLLGEKLNLPFQFNHVFNLAIDAIINQSSISADSNVLNSFWKMLEFLSFEGHIKNDEDYCVQYTDSIKIRNKKDKEEIIDFTKNKNVLFVRFQRIYPKYAENHRKQTGENGHSETSLKSYMKSDKSYLGSVKVMDFGPIKSSAYAFDMDKLSISLKDVILQTGEPFAPIQNYSAGVQKWNSGDESNDPF